MCRKGLWLIASLSTILDLRHRRCLATTTIAGRFCAHLWFLEVTSCQLLTTGSLSSWWFQPWCKKYESNWIISPGRVEHKKILETTTQLWVNIRKTNSPTLLPSFLPSIAWGNNLNNLKVTATFKEQKTWNSRKSNQVEIPEKSNLEHQKSWFRNK